MEELSRTAVARMGLFRVTQPVILPLVCNHSHPGKWLPPWACIGAPNALLHLCNCPNLARFLSNLIVAPISCDPSSTPDRSPAAQPVREYCVVEKVAIRAKPNEQCLWCPGLRILEQPYHRITRRSSWIPGCGLHPTRCNIVANCLGRRRLNPTNPLVRLPRPRVPMTLPNFFMATTTIPST